MFLKASVVPFIFDEVVVKRVGELLRTKPDISERKIIYLDYKML